MGAEQIRLPLISEPARLNMVEIWLNIQFDIFFAVKYVLNMVEI